MGPISSVNISVNADTNTTLSVNGTSINQCGPSKRQRKRQP